MPLVGSVHVPVAVGESVLSNNAQLFVAVADIRRLQGLGGIGVYFVDDRFRRTGGRDQTKPTEIFKARQRLRYRAFLLLRANRAVSD